MIRGIFTSASGMMTESRKLDVIGNNISNINTSGYKQQVLTQGSFESELLDRMLDGTTVGSSTAGSKITGTAIDFSQGSYEQTSIPTDLAVMGDGFFAVQDSNGNVKYTRNSTYTLDTQGYLALANGERLMSGSGQPLYVGDDKFSVASNGAVTLSNGQTSFIPVYSAANTQGITKRADGFYDITGAVQTAGKIGQGYVEGSNVNAATEMTGMMSATRNFQANSEAFKVTGETLDRLIAQVGTIK